MKIRKYENVTLKWSGVDNTATDGYPRKSEVIKQDYFVFNYSETRVVSSVALGTPEFAVEVKDIMRIILGGNRKFGERTRQKRRRVTPKL